MSTFADFLEKLYEYGHGADVDPIPFIEACKDNAFQMEARKFYSWVRTLRSCFYSHGIDPTKLYEKGRIDALKDSSLD